MPAFAIAAARFTATVDLPTPPLALATTRMRSMPGTGFSPCAGPGTPWLTASSDSRAPLVTRRRPATGEPAGAGAPGCACPWACPCEWLCPPAAFSAVRTLRTAVMPGIRAA